MMLRGSQVVAIFERALKRWSETTSWRDRASQLVREFYQDKNQDPSQDLANLDAISSLLDPRMWQSKIKSELGSNRALDDFDESQRSEALLALRPHGLLLHICPGNSFLGGLDSVLHGVVTGNRNIAKLSRNAPPILTLIAELLESCGLPVGQIQTVFFDSGSEDEKRHRHQADAIVVWGSEEAVRHYSKDLAPGTRFIEYGPKLSFSLASALGWKNNTADLDGLVADACSYEQVSCASSQLLLLEVPAELEGLSNDHPARLQFNRSVLEKTAEAFRKYSRSHPPQRTKHEQLELLKSVERAKLHSIHGKGDFVSGYPDWLICLKDSNSPIEPSPLYRTWLIYPFERGKLSGHLEPIRRYLQTCSLLCDPTELHSLTEDLWSLGVNRVVQPCRSTEPMSGAPHDGGYILQKFCRTVSLESPRRNQHLWYRGDSDLTLNRLRALLGASSSAPFYRRRFEEAGIRDLSLLTWEQFEHLPWLLKEDVHRYAPPISSDLLTTPYENVTAAYVFTTGGSTGEPKYALYSRDEWEEVTDIFSKEFAVAGLSSHDRVANLFVGGGLWSAFIAVSEGLEKLGCINLPVGGDMEPEAALELLYRLGATACFGLPSTLLKLANAAEARTERKPKLRMILYGGEHMSEAMRQAVSHAFGGATVHSGSYAAVDAGCIGYQCLLARGGVQHALEGYCHVEICDEETGLPVEPGRTGEIIVTNLSRTLFPIVRLRTGDRGRAVTEPCACGSKAFTFELLGRSDDMVRVSGANVFTSDVERLCQKYSRQLSLIYQLRASKSADGIQDCLEVVLETREILSEKEALALQEKVLSSYLEIADEVRLYMKKGLLNHLSLTLVSPGSIEPSSKTRKIKRVVDNRQP